MRFTYNQYNYYESGYRIPSKMHSINNNNFNSNGGSTSSLSSYQHHHKSNFGMRMTMSTASTMTSRIHRKGFRTPSKRHPGKALPGKLHSISRIGPGKLIPGKRIPQRPHPPPCDNSNDSGFGFDQHVEIPSQQQQQHHQQQHQHQQHQQQQQQQQHNNAQQQQQHNLSSSSSSNLSSSSNSSTNSHHHHHNNNSNNNHHNHGTIQHSPQQHLIRAIPSSRSPTKKIHFLDNDADEEEVIEIATHTDSDDPMSFNGSSSNSRSSSSTIGYKNLKRLKLDTPVDLDNDDACSEDAFIRKIASANCATELELNVVPTNMAPQIQIPDSNVSATQTKFMPTGGRMARVAHKRQPATPPNSVATSNNGRVQLEIISQPEQQHRARYQTEGSRGAVKDRTGNGFPVVRLVGYGKPTVLQVFIGTDIGRVAPHMFYQACKVAGKNSTQCNEKKVDGTMVIEIDFKPETDMTVTCDCVGILKERNVDVEHRFPDHLAQKNKKKSTRCRMVFRTQLTHDDGAVETLQVCSNPIICTQPPGVPEICKKSLDSCPVDGGLELFIIGKNFLKDTHVVFQETYESIENDHQMVPGGPLWEQNVLPDKEYLQQTHLICTVPPYIHQNILKPVTVQVSIISSGKKSESHSFVYTPKGTYSPLAAATTLSSTLHGSLSATQDAATSAFMNANALASSLPPPAASAVNGASALWSPVEPKHEVDAGMMPPPITTQIPIVGVRRPSLNNNSSATPMITGEQLAHLSVVAAEALKTELIDESSQNSLADAMHSSESNGVCGPHSPTAMQFHSRYARKASMEAMIYEQSNSLPGFPAATAATQMAAAVGMAVKNELAKELLHQQQQQAAAASVDQFITDLTKSAAVGVNNVTPSPAVVAAAASTLFDHPIADIFQQAGVATVPPTVTVPTALERSLSLSSNSSSLSSVSNSSSPMSSSCSVTGASPVNSLTGHSSPLSQDIILNSEPAVALNATLPMQQLLPPQIAATAISPVAADGDVAVAQGVVPVTGGLSTDMILNPAVSPSTILCSANGAATAVVHNIMAPHQVTMANSILNDIAMQPQPTQQDATVAALALSNIMMSSPGSNGGVAGADITVPPAPVAVPPEVTTATSTAVSNMIIKAAADFISNQEQQSHHHQHQHQQQQQQAMLSANAGVGVGVGPTATTTDPLVNLLLNHEGTTNTPQASVAVATAAVAAVGEVQPQFSLGIPPAAPQESLIVALAAENGLQKSVAAAAVTTDGAVVTQQTASTTAGIHTAAVGAVTAAVPLPPTIPQELTTMSDQDLLSYINPSTFDQI